MPTTDTETGRWIDTGATWHMCKDESKFDDFTMLEESQDVKLGDGHRRKVICHRSIILDLKQRIQFNKCKLSDVLYVPNLTYNLLSVSKTAEVMNNTLFTSDGCGFINDTGDIVATGKKKKHLYYLDCIKIIKLQWAHRLCYNIIYGTAIWPHQNWRSQKTYNWCYINQPTMWHVTRPIGVCGRRVDGKQHQMKYISNWWLQA